MQEEETEPSKVQEVVDVVTTAKLITEVVTAASTAITAAEVPVPAATTTAAAPSRRTKGVVIRDLEESTTTTYTIIHTEVKSKDKDKEILVEEPKPLKKQAQMEQDEQYATERVEHLELDKISQALEITKLKRRVKKLERRNKERMIVEMDQDADVVLEEAKEVADDVKADQDAKVDESVDI
nr:hypothetical protein [Tanacetum cinerariifolium]